MATHQTAAGQIGRPGHRQRRKITMAFVNQHDLALVIDAAARVRALDKTVMLQKQKLADPDFLMGLVYAFAGTTNEITTLSSDKRWFDLEHAQQTTMLNEQAKIAIAKGPKAYKEFLDKTARHLSEMEVINGKMMQVAQANRAHDATLRHIQRNAAYVEFAAGVAFKTWQLGVGTLIPGPAGTALVAEGILIEGAVSIAAGKEPPVHALVAASKDVGKEVFEHCAEKAAKASAQYFMSGKIKSLESEREWATSMIEGTMAELRLPQAASQTSSLIGNVVKYDEDIFEASKGLEKIDGQIEMAGKSVKVLGGVVGVAMYGYESHELWDHLQHQLKETGGE